MQSDLVPPYILLILYNMHPCVGPLPNDDWNTTSHHEPAGSSPITTGNISISAPLFGEPLSKANG